MEDDPRQQHEAGEEPRTVSVHGAEGHGTVEMVEGATGARMPTTTSARSHALPVERDESAPREWLPLGVAAALVSLLVIIVVSLLT